MSGARRYGPEDVGPAEKARALAVISSTDWRTSPDLAGRAHMDERLFQATVAVLVLGGRPIVSGGSGYRLSNDPVEVAKAGGSLVHRGTEIIKRGRALVETAKVLRGGPVQPSLF